MNLRTERITSEHKDIKIIESLYSSAFPSNEKIPFPVLLRQDLDGIEFLAFYDDDTFCGFTYLFTKQDITFLFYFAIMPELRNHGYGSGILEYLSTQRSQQRLILDIEAVIESAPNYPVRQRRKAFYERNGYQSAGIYYHLLGLDYEMLIHGGSLEPEELKQLLITLWGEKANNMVLSTTPVTTTTD